MGALSVGIVSKVDFKIFVILFSAKPHQKKGGFLMVLMRR